MRSCHIDILCIREIISTEINQLNKKTEKKSISFLLKSVKGSARLKKHIYDNLTFFFFIHIITTLSLPLHKNKNSKLARIFGASTLHEKNATNFKFLIQHSIMSVINSWMKMRERSYMAIYNHLMHGNGVGLSHIKLTSAHNFSWEMPAKWEMNEKWVRNSIFHCTGWMNRRECLIFCVGLCQFPRSSCYLSESSRWAVISSCSRRQAIEE